MDLFLVSVTVGVGVAVIAWEVQLLVRVHRQERKALQFVRDVDQVLGPVMRTLEEGMLEISRCIMTGMTAMANAIAPPLDWLFDDKEAAQDA